MSIVEETSKVTQSAISALNSVPVLLSLVLLQFFILGGIMYMNSKRDENVHARFMFMIEKCTVPYDKRTELPEGANPWPTQQYVSVLGTQLSVREPLESSTK